jgi:hypothetical protein
MQRGPDTQDDAQKQSNSARTHGAFGLLVFGRRMRVSSIVEMGKIHCISAIGHFEGTRIVTHGPSSDCVGWQCLVAGPEGIRTSGHFQLSFFIEGRETASQYLAGC